MVGALETATTAEGKLTHQSMLEESIARIVGLQREVEELIDIARRHRNAIHGASPEAVADDNVEPQTQPNLINAVAVLGNRMNRLREMVSEIGGG